MNNPYVGRVAMGLYLILFFAYLLGPLAVMGLTAFNSSSFPSVSPWACFTFEWYGVLFQDERILNGIKNSMIIGLGTVVMSVAIGLSASLVLTQIWPKLRSTYYTIIIAPILIPGVVLGISTIVFWDRVGRMFGAESGSALDALFHHGIFLTIIGQSTFIASYCMLVFVARLQRFDSGLTEAALDLGATHTQAFRKIMLPFMRPAIASASVLAFLASFENYNTTTFTFGKYPTLTIELAQKVRYGINPSISALAFIIVMFTIFGALAVEAYRRNNNRKLAAAKAGVPLQSGGFVPGFLKGNPAAVILVFLSFLVIAMVGTSQSYSPAQCKAQVLEAKKADVKKAIEALRLKRTIQDQQGDLKGPDIFGQDPAKDGNFGGVFDPDNLQNGEAPAVVSPTEKKKSQSGAFGGVFDPTCLSGEDKPKKKKSQSGAFGGVFDPNTLKND